MKSILLIIDAQRGVFESTPPPHDAAAVLSCINGLSERARAAGTPVVFAQHECAGSPLEYGSEKWALDCRLHVDERDVVLRKTTPDAFLRSELSSLLEMWAVEELIVCGYASEFCVDTTTRRAAALGFSVVLVADGHTTHDKAHASAEQIRTHHNATLPNVGLVFGGSVKALMARDVVFENGVGAD